MFRISDLEYRIRINFIISVSVTFVFIIIVKVRTNDTIERFPLLSFLLSNSFVVISVRLHVRPPEVLELLRNLGGGDLLQSEDEDPGDDDTEDIEEGEGQTDQAKQEGLE